MDTKTDYYARSDSSSFPLAEKLSYYVEADGILNGLIIQQQEDRGESEPTAITTVAATSEYAETSRIHHINWLKISYDGTNFIPAKHRSEQELISLYGSSYETTLTGWSAAEPIYTYKRNKLFVYPAPTAAQAGAGRLKYSVELLPTDLIANGTPTLVPANYHYLHSAYAAMSWLDEDDPLRVKAEKRWTSGTALMLETMYPRAMQQEFISSVPADDGSDY